MMAISWQLWGTLLLSITMLSFELGGEDCNRHECRSQCTNGGNHSDPLRNCSGGNYAGCVKCKGKVCKQNCDSGVDLCEMDLECESGDCDQTCKANRCKLNCSGRNCKTQKCEGNGCACEMNLECNGPNCDQTCKANRCKLNCSGRNCKTQKCEGNGCACEMNLECNGPNCDQTCKANWCKLNCRGSNCTTQKCEGNGCICEMNLECNGSNCEQTCKANKCKLNCSGRNCTTQNCDGNGNACKMNLECNGSDCKQTCNAKRCKLNCSGRNCKKQYCTGHVKVCNMHCNADDCEQMCEGTCNITRTWPTSSHNKLICSGNGECCKRLMLTSKSWSLTTSISQTGCDGGKSCICTKFSDSHGITSDLYTSNSMTSIGASKIPVFAAKTSTGHGTEAFTLLQSTLQSPLSLISPSPLPSSSPHSSSAAILPAGASSSTSALSPSSKPAATSASGSASGSSPAASSAAVLPAGVSATSSAPSRSSSKPTATFGSTPGSESSAAAALAASLSSSPSLQTPLPSTLEEIKNLANDSAFKLKGGEINRSLSSMEALRIFEDFITSIQILQKPVTEEEIEIVRNSIFKVAVALEVFALNYGKHQMIGVNSLVEINSRKLVLAIQKTYRKNASDFFLWRQELQASLEVSSKNFANDVSVVVGIVYKDLHDVLITDQPFRTIRYLDSWVTAVALDPKPEKLEENVILRFRNLKIREGDKKCMFWSGVSESSGGFSETGCHLVTSKSNSEETVCSCNHLTHFGVLLDYNGSPGLTEEDETILEIITYLGLSLSIFAIFMTIILYSYLTDVWQPLTQIRLSLSVSLGAGQMIFLTGINATGNTALCVLAAVFLQYFLMAAFCWMLVEGIYFFLFVVKVYNINTKMHMYHFISWGSFISLDVNYCKLLNRKRLKIRRMTSRVALTSFF